MKKLIGLVKSNLLIVIIIVVALVAIPVQLYFSSQWNQEIRDGVSSDAKQTISKLDQIPVTYEIPGMLTSDGQAWQSERVAPSSLANERMRVVLEKLSSDAEKVRDVAISHNRREKGLLIGGDGDGDVLFPAPSDESARVRMLTELTRVHPAAYASLLADAGAGMPPASGEVVRTLEARRARLVQERVQGRVEQALTEEEEAEIQGLLSEARLSLYEQHADRITFYGDPLVFSGVREWAAGETLPTLDTAWEWQVRYWVVEDLIAALSKANMDRSGIGLTAPRGPVKRLLSVEVMSLAEGSSLGGGGGVVGGRRGGAEEARSLPQDPNAVIAPTYEVSFTGRAGYPVAPNALYDVRYATVRAVVDMNRVPDVLEAISTTNFMSVIDLDLEAVDPVAALGQGFVYGGDSVAIMTVRVETIWLRSWMKDWMPREVRERLGIPQDPEPDSDSEGEEFEE